MRWPLIFQITAAAIVAVPLMAAGQDRDEMGTATTPEGITVTVKSDVWSGEPRHLHKVHPVLVTVENNSQVPIRLRYDAFRLIGRTEQSAALAPSEITGHETEPGPYSYAYSGYYPGAYWGGYAGYAGPYFYDAWYSPGYVQMYVRYDLPTEDMVERILPEKVLEVGEKVTGFLYFDDIHLGHHDRGTFVADLVNASTAETVGTIKISLEVD